MNQPWTVLRVVIATGVFILITVVTATTAIGQEVPSIPTAAYPPSRSVPADVSAKAWFDPSTTRYVGTPMDPAVADMERIDPARYLLEAVRVEKPPRLDGLLDDPVWRQAPAAAGFRQMLPDEGRLDTEQTEVRILYDTEKLYIGVLCYDKEPHKVVATEMRRDINVDDDDAFDVAIAPYGDNGESYYFITNPLGSRRDVLVGASVRSWNPDWDAIWECSAKRHRLGWSLEIAIPFKTFRFEAQDEQTWGINFGRHVQRTHADAFWVPVNRKDGFIGMYKYAKGGQLIGLKGIKPGRALEVLPYAVTGGLGARHIGQNGERLRFRTRRDVGGNLKWGITSGITADATINPDFAQIEADREVVNLSRFEFRFNEKRPFFLEGASLFQFGSFFSPLSLFFSRRIGTQLFDGSTVRILHGEKLSGKLGRANFGFLNVQTEETPWALTASRVVTLRDTTATASGGLQITERDTLNLTRFPLLERETNWNVFRVKRDLFARSSIGLIGLMKEPEETPDGQVALPGFRLSATQYNRVIGLDTNLQFNTNRHEVELLLARSWLPEAELTHRLLQEADSTALRQPGRDWAGAIRHSWRNSWFDISSGYTDVRAGFHTDMGFVPRRDVRRATGSIGMSRLLRKWGIRSIGQPFGGLIQGQWVTDHRSAFFDRDHVESWDVGVSPGLEFENGTFAYVQWQRSFDRLSYPTPIAGVNFGAGPYTFDTVSGGFFTDRGKRVSGSAFYTQGDFYNARLRNVSLTTMIKPTTRSLVRLELENNRLTSTRAAQDSLARLSSFDERWITRLRLNYSFTTEMFMSAFVQMNANRQTPGGPLRVRALVSNLLFAYTMQQGHTVFVAYNQYSDDAFDVRGRRSLRPATQAVVAKFSYLFNI